MIPVKFKEVNIILAKDQPEYQPLPVQYNNDLSEGPMTSFWKLNEAELAQINKTGGIYIKQLTFNKGFQPIHPTVYNPFRVLEIAYYKEPGEGMGFTGLVPLEDNTFAKMPAFTVGQLIDNIITQYTELQPENLCLVLIDQPTALFS